MVKTIFTSLSPNLESDDILEATSILLKPWLWQDEEPVRALEKRFCEVSKLPYAFAFASGRTCLYAILSALHLHSDEEVLLQAYTCVAVPNPILWTNTRPVYVDCDPDSYNISLEDLRRKITPKSRVLIIQHTFGQPAPLDELLEIARVHHLFVIEDCAHALGATYDDRLVGTFGDASFFSFGRDKVLSSIFGGMLLVKDQGLAKTILAYQTSLTKPKAGWVAQQLLHPLLTDLIKVTYDVGIGKLLLLIAKKTHLLSQPVQTREKQGEAPTFVYQRFSGALARLALHQLKKQARFQAHRTTIAHRYSERLKGTSLLLPRTPRDTDPAWLRYAVRTPRAAEMLREAKREKIHLGDWYRTPIAPQGVNYDRICYHDCPTAAKIADETLNLPTDIHITTADADRIIHFLLRFV